MRRNVLAYAIAVALGQMIQERAWHWTTKGFR